MDPTETLSWGTASWRDVLAVNSIVVVQIAIVVHFDYLDKTRTNNQVVKNTGNAANENLAISNQHL